MRREVDNRNKDSNFYGPYAGRNLNVTNIIMLQDSEREFVVTHNADIKPVSYFTGRETELQELRQRIEEGRKSVLVSGMGGIGKTHICRKLFEEYLNRHAEGGNEPFCHIGYIEYAGDMSVSLTSCLKYRQQDAPEQNHEAAWRELEYLASGGKLLLFVDNVDKPISEDSGLQRLKGIPGAIVLTSRQTSICDEFEPFPICFLDMEQCKEIYEKIRFMCSGKKVRPEEEQDLKYVIEDLAGRHTITVELLAHLARTKTWSVRKLREKLEQKGFCLAFHKNGELVNIQESYEALYDLSELTEAEQNILEAFSLFPYIPLAAEMCNEWLLKDAGVSEDDDVLVGLYQKGWLQFDMEQENYALHPVFAQFIYEKCKPRMEEHLGLIESFNECLEIPKSGSVIECQRYIPFAQDIVEIIGMGMHAEYAQFINSFAILLRYIGEYKDAEELYNKALLIREKTLGKEHLDTAISYNNLAGVYADQKKYREAEELYKKSIQIHEKILGKEHPDTATCYNNLAGVYADQKKYSEAEGLYKKALRIKEKVLGDEHLDTAISYNNLAEMYKSQGKYSEAERLYKKALQIREKVLGDEHPTTSTSYNNLAALYFHQKKYREAEELCKKALRIREKVLGDEYLDTATAYNNLAILYCNLGKYNIALEYSLKACKIVISRLEEEHPTTKMAIHNLVGIYTKCNHQENFVQWLLEKMKEW